MCLLFNMMYRWQRVCGWRRNHEANWGGRQLAFVSPIYMPQHHRGRRRRRMCLRLWFAGCRERVCAGSLPDRAVSHGKVAGLEWLWAGDDSGSPARRLQHLGNSEPARLLQDQRVSGVQGVVSGAQDLQPAGVLREETPRRWQRGEGDGERGGGEQPRIDRADPGSVQQQRAREAHLAQDHPADPEAARVQPPGLAAGLARHGRAGGSVCVRILPGTAGDSIRRCCGQRPERGGQRRSHLHGPCLQKWPGTFGCRGRERPTTFTCGASLKTEFPLGAFLYERNNV